LFFKVHFVTTFTVAQLFLHKAGTIPYLDMVHGDLKVDVPPPHFE